MKQNLKKYLQWLRDMQGMTNRVSLASPSDDNLVCNAILYKPCSTNKDYGYNYAIIYCTMTCRCLPMTLTLAQMERLNSRY